MCTPCQDALTARQPPRRSAAMPCYLFTYHGYGTWMPDQPRGYVKRKVGILAPNVAMAECYRSNQKQETVTFDERVQKLLLNEAVKAFRFQGLRGHFIATDPTHLHVLVSWKSAAHWQAVRSSVRSSLTRRLNQEIERRSWFAKQPSRKRVKDRQHFEHLVQAYLPRHRGLKWREGLGLFE